MGKVQPMDPQSILTYSHDWSDWLTGDDTLTTSTWSVDPEGSLAVDSDSNTTTTTTVTLSGPTKGLVYEVINHIVTVAGEACDRMITIRAGNR